MPIVLALEPEEKQAAALERVVRDRVKAEFVRAESKDAAIAAIRSRVPDLILLTALLSPRDESEIADLIRDLEGAEHTQTLTIPLLDVGGARPARKKKRGLLSALTGEADAPGAPSGCDPAVFADEIGNYLQQAEHAKAEGALTRERRAKKPKRKKRDAADTAQADAPVADAGTSAYWSWDPPAEPATVSPAETDAVDAAPAALPDRTLRTGDTSPLPTASAEPSSWANPWDVSAPSIWKPAPEADSPAPQVDAAAPDPFVAAPAAAIEALLDQPAPTTAAEQLAAVPVRIADFVRDPQPEAAEPPAVPEPSAALQAFEASTPSDLEPAEPQPPSMPGPVAALPPAPEPVVAAAEDDDEPAAKRRPRVELEPEIVAARLPTRSESGALLALQADVARLRQQRASTDASLVAARAAQERATKAAAEAAEHARREADRRAEEAAARSREEAKAERRAREQAERRAKEEAERRAEAEKRAREEAERLAAQAAQRARDEAARQARLEAERLVEAERKARAEAERRATAERVAREEAERRAKEETARLEREARERQAHAEAERKAREAAEAHAAAERKAREQAERRAREEADRVAREVERKAQEQADRLAREAERRAREEAERIAREAERRSREEAERIRLDAERRATEKAEQAAREAERKVRAEAEQRARAEAEKLAKQLEAKARAEALSERRAREEAERRAEAERQARMASDKRAEAERKAREEAERAAEAAQTSASRKTVPARKGRKAAPAPKRARKDAEPRAVQDEWGLYDPQAAGFEALFAKLEAIEQGEEAREPDPPQPAAETRRGPRPLAMWAFQFEAPDDPAAVPSKRRHDEFRALVSQFSIPHAVAAVGYATGARIRKVRVRETARARAATDADPRVVILSRRLLKAARRQAAATDRLTARR